MGNKKMTIFYKIVNKEMMRVCSGEQNLTAIGNLTEDEAKLIWDYFYINFDKYIFEHLEEFELIEIDNKLQIRMKEETKESIKKYL
ncbi:hypothetical protein DVV91_16770 [Clostridium botulinum]|uniref:hypothetical protein n=1 Tax=Clostridium TaxID=1485 RepID=UPI001967776C|nr:MULTISPECIES: hypothetical protein [Clostridium]MBN1075976.1 hypothetical protein [Clostridium botulinum]